MEKNSSKLTIIRDNTFLFTAIWSDSAFWFWRASLGSELLDLLERDVETIRARMTDEYVFLTVLIGEKRDPPSDEARKRMSEILKQSSSRLVARAIVIESEGFTATVSRGAITDIEVGSQRRKSAYQVFRSVREATGWLAQSLGRDQSWASEFNKVVTEQRARLGQGPA
ncbi:MAG: hypothetical protein JXA30_23370 [Deltaproteobacteria bacterium]|nr:hypothetical protein [Deltaproteobacteria bacterium]